MKITILGAGAYGRALGFVLEKNGHEVQYYDPVLPVKLEGALCGAELQVLAVPSKQAPRLLPHLKKDVPLVVATKGILNLKTFEGFDKVMVMSGAGFASDIMHQRKTTLTATDDGVVKIFENSWLKFDRTDDAAGVLMCGALKNVYAVLAGYKNLKPGSVRWEKFVAEAVQEMKLVLLMNGAEPRTVELSCGEADLRLTCAYPSRNYGYGMHLALNPNYETEQTIEGIETLSKIKSGAIIVPPQAFLLKEMEEIWD